MSGERSADVGGLGHALHMIDQDLVQRAELLGQDHAEADWHNKLPRRLRTGYAVAEALGAEGVKGQLAIDLLDAYNGGWSSWA
jgi:hypothetical protein